MVKITRNLPDFHEVESNLIHHSLIECNISTCYLTFQNRAWSIAMIYFTVIQVGPRKVLRRVRSLQNHIPYKIHSPSLLPGKHYFCLHSLRVSYLNQNSKCINQNNQLPVNVLMCVFEQLPVNLNEVKETWFEKLEREELRCVCWDRRWTLGVPLFS